MIPKQFSPCGFMHVFFVGSLALFCCLMCQAEAAEVDFPSAPPHEIGLSAERLESVTAMLRQEVASGRIAGAVAAVARHGRLGYCQAVGYRDSETQSAMEPDTLFRIASMTKVITSAGIMSLCEDGRLSLSDPLTKFLPEFANAEVLAEIEGESLETEPARRDITIHDLLTHRSGLTYGWFGPEKLDGLYRENGVGGWFLPSNERLADRVDRIATLPLKFQPGTAWDYGVSTDVLGRVIEIASGLPLDRFFYERFFRPLRMRDTWFHVPDDKQPRLATLYSVDEDGVLFPVGSEPTRQQFLKFSGDYCTDGNNRVFSGGGGLVSSAIDYLRFLQMLSHGGTLDDVRVLSSDSVARMTGNQIGEMHIPFPDHGDGFGFGFGVQTDRAAGEDRFSVGSFSWGGIFNTYFWVDPQEDLVGVLMTQVFPNGHLQTRSQFKDLVYDAIDDSGFRRVYWYEPGIDHANPHFNGRQLRVSSPEASVHKSFARRSEPRSSGQARILIEEDLLHVKRAEIATEIWGGHPGTANKRLALNGRRQFSIPEVGCAQEHCTHQYPRFNLHPQDLVSGYNALQFSCDQGDSFWGHYIVDNVAIEIGLPRDDAQLVESHLGAFDAEVTAEAVTSNETIRLGIRSDSLAKIQTVHYQARYLGYDENGNHWNTDWHGMTKHREPYGIVGSVSDAPFRLDWNVSMIPAQTGVQIRALIEMRDAPQLRYQTPVRSGIEIQRDPSRQVTLLGPDELPEKFWSRAGKRKDLEISLDFDPKQIEAAELHVVTWTGGAGQVDEYFTLNGHHLPVAEGSDHEVIYSRVPIDPRWLRRGANAISLLSDTEHHGIEVMRPGPTLAVRYVTTDSPDDTDSTSDIKDYERFAMTRPGNAERGQKLFADKEKSRCAICHVVNGSGGAVGPDLSSIGGKFDRPHLIESLLEPSKQIVEGYRSTIVLTQQGDVLHGVIRKQDQQSIWLLDAEGKEHRIAIAEIEQRRESDASLMPKDIHTALTLEQFTDVVAYLETLRPGGKLSPGAKTQGPITLPAEFEIETVATGLSGCTALETLPDGRILICEQTGTLRVVSGGELLPEPALRLEVDSHWERGLIGVTIDPDFANTGHVYLVYVSSKPFPHHRISRFTMAGDEIDASSERILLKGDDQRTLGGNVPAGHQGGAIHFGPDGMLYVGIGEHTNAPASQQMNTFQGKILRVAPDGSIPPDNPFYETATGKYRAIFALGLRNPYTFAFEPDDGRLLVNDVGGKFEEINSVESGKNYGWPSIEHGPHNDASFGSPLYWYPQASIAGGDFQPKRVRWPSAFRGKYFFADFVHGWIRTHDPSEKGKAEEFASGLTRPVDLRFGQDGALYVLTRNAWVIDGKFQGGTGSLVRITYLGD